MARGALSQIVPLDAGCYASFPIYLYLYPYPYIYQNPFRADQAPEVIIHFLNWAP